MSCGTHSRLVSPTSSLMRQHPWLATLIDNGTLASPGDESVRASVARAARSVDARTYVVALASDGAIDEPGAISVLAEAAELRDLQDAAGRRWAARSFVPRWMSRRGQPAKT